VVRPTPAASSSSGSGLLHETDPRFLIKPSEAERPISKLSFFRRNPIPGAFQPPFSWGTIGKGRDYEGERGVYMPNIDPPIDLNALDAEITRVQALNQTLLQDREVLNRNLATLVHDLRNYLSTSKVCAQLLLRHPEADRETIAKYAARIVSAIDRADELIDPLEPHDKKGRV
jgi:signal transduction histidine kinase